MKSNDRLGLWLSETLATLSIVLSILKRILYIVACGYAVQYSVGLA